MREYLMLIVDKLAFVNEKPVAVAVVYTEVLLLSSFRREHRTGQYSSGRMAQCVA